MQGTTGDLPPPALHSRGGGHQALAADQADDDAK